MAERFSITIDHELKLIRYRHTGCIKAEEIEQAWLEFLNLKEFTNLGYNLLSDYRGGRFEIPVKFLPELMNFMNAIREVIVEVE